MAVYGPHPDPAPARFTSGLTLSSTAGKGIAGQSARTANGQNLLPNIMGMGLGPPEIFTEDPSSAKLPGEMHLATNPVTRPPGFPPLLQFARRSASIRPKAEIAISPSSRPHMANLCGSARPPLRANSERAPEAYYFQDPSDIRNHRPSSFQSPIRKPVPSLAWLILPSSRFPRSDSRGRVPPDRHGKMDSGSHLFPAPRIHRGFPIVEAAFRNTDGSPEQP